jgi:cytochrome b561
MGVLIIGAAVFAALLGAGAWVAKAPQGPRAVLGIAVDVLTGAFLMQLTTARTAPRRAHPHRPAVERRDVATPAAASAGVHTRAPAPAEPSTSQWRPERATARR